MNKKLVILSSIGIVISVAASYFAFRNIPAADLFRYMRTIEPGWILLSVGLCIFSFYFRIQRWRIILGEQYRLSFWEAYHPMMIGFMTNYILPGRVGEIVRPVVLKKKENVPFSIGLATIALERLFDLIFMLIFLTVSLTQVEINEALNIPFGDYTLNSETIEKISQGMFFLLAGLLGGVLLLSFSSSRTIIQSTISGVPGLFFFLSLGAREKMDQRIFAPINRLLDNFSIGFSQIKDPGRIAGCLLFSAGLWVVSALSYYTMSLGSPGIDMSFGAVFIMMIIICSVIALPSVPGFWGVWEAGGLFALSIFSITGEAAAGYTLLNHAVQILPIIPLGFISVFVIGENLFSLQKRGLYKTPIRQKGRGF